MKPTRQISTQAVVEQLAQAEHSLFESRSPAERAVLTKYRDQLMLAEAKPVPKQLRAAAPATPLSSEERQAVLEKLSAISQLSGISLEKSDRLYLEQQLSELLGFEVTTQLGSQSVPNVTAVIQAGMHILRTPTDKLERHNRIPEAGITRHRSQFGWQRPIDESGYQPDETYGISISVRSLQVGPERTLAEHLTWYAQQKLLVINATEHIAAVASVTDTFIDTSDKYQYSVTPELARDTKLWSPQNQGRAVVLFVVDPSNVVDTGIYNLT